MRRITPTGWGQTGGREISLLGSTEAVLNAIGDDSFLVVSCAVRAVRAMDLCQDLRMHGQAALESVPDGAKVGVDVEAWHGVMRPIWDVVEATIKRRFPEAVWG